MDQPIKEAIILAGGLGTRLQNTIGGIPKPLAPVNGKPFLHYLFIYLKKQGVTSVVLSVGYQWEMIQKHFQQTYLGINIKYAIEQEALGTGGAIRMALELIDGEVCYVLNGDTYFDIELQDLGTFHLKNKAECTLAATTRHNFDRFGTLDIAPNGTVMAFNEKQPRVQGIINGGIYCVSKTITRAFPGFDVFSFEKDYLETNTEIGAI